MIEREADDVGRVVEVWIRSKGYGLALLATSLAILARLILEPWLGARAPYLLFTVPVLAAAGFGGIGPAFLAALVGLAAGVTMDGARLRTDESVASAGVYLLASALTIVIAGRLGSLQARSAMAARQAETRAESVAVIAEQLNRLIDGASEYAIYMLDADGRVLIWNAGAERLKGWSEAEVVGQDAAMFYPADTREDGKPRADLARVREQGWLEEEVWRLRKDGSEFLAHVSMSAVRDEAGRLIGYAKVLRDITDQRAAEQAVRASAEHLESILATVPDAMVVIDERGVIVSFSAAAERLFGWREDEVVGTTVKRLMPSPDNERHDSYIEHYLETGERRIIGLGRVVTGLRRDGTTFPMELAVGETSGAGRRLFTGFCRDLTERMRIQSRLEELQAELIHIARVTGMGAMASTLAHELNQPITAVVNYVQAVRSLLDRSQGCDMPMIHEALEDAASEALRAGQIVRRLRDFVARGEVEKTVEDLCVVVRESVALGLTGARDDGVEISLDLPARGPLVLIDRIQIEQVIINLARNAVEATRAVVEGPHLWISVIGLADGLARVTVADNGPGVAEPMVGQLFTAFVSTKIEGMGLGLSICRTIVEANGGRIWYEDRPGGGAMFHFTVMRADLEQSYG